MGRHKAYDRQRVLKRAMELFWKKGFEGAHLQELVDFTGLNRFSLYKEFGGKEGLFEEALDLYLRGLSELAQVLWREPLGLQNVLDYVQGLVKGDFSYGCFMVNTLVQKHVVQSKVVDRVKEFAGKAEQAMYANFQAAQKAGDLPKEIDVASLAKFFMVFDIGLVTFELLSPSQQEKENIIQSLIKVFLTGIQSPPSADSKG